MSGKHPGRIYFGSILIALIFVGALIFIGRVPFPGDFMRAWYEPWRTETVIDGVPTIPHKAVGHDIFRQIYPFKALSVDLFRHGSIPLWNPYNGAGQPLLAAGIQTIFNPFMIIFAFTNPETAWIVLYIGQFVVLFCAYVLFVSSLGVSALAAGISSIFFLGSSFIIANSLFGTFLYSFAGLPWLLWCIDRIHHKEARGWRILPIAVAWTILTGFPQLTMYIFLVVGAYALFRLWTTRSWTFWVTLIFYGIVGIGLSAIQLIPQYELYQHAAIDTASSSFIFRTFLMPISHMVSLIIPNFFGNPAIYNYWGYADYIETAVSVGSVASLFVIIGVLFYEKKNRTVLAFFVSLCFGALFLAIRSPITEWLYRLPIPVLTTGVPTRSLGICTFAFCIIAAYGIDIFLARQDILKRLYLPVGIVWGILGMITVGVRILSNMHVSCNNSVITSCFSIAFRNSVLETVVFTAVVMVIGLSKIVHGRMSHRFMVFGIVSIVICSGVYNAYKFVPFTSSKNFMPEHPLLTYLRQRAPDRIAYQGASIPTNLATHYRFFDTNYYTPLYIRRYGELVSYVNTGSRTENVRRSDIQVVDEATVSAELSFRRNRFWDMTGSSMVLTKNSDALQMKSGVGWEDAHWQVYQRPTALSRAYVVQTIIVEPDDSRLLSGVFAPETDLAKTAFVEVPISGIQGSGDGSGTADILEYTANRIVLAVDTSAASLVVLSDTYFPGWQATVDGAERRVYRTNYAFRGAIVPKGKHTVVFHYQPSSFAIGGLISVISVVVWGGLVLWSFKKKQ